MAKIVVFLNGTQIKELELDPAREYVVGRASTCDIVLDHVEVSRQHAKLAFDGEGWSCQVMSRYGRLMAGGCPVETVSLVGGSSFSIPPFELRFLSAQAGVSSTAEPREISFASAPEASIDKTSTGISNVKTNLYRLGDQGRKVSEIALGPELVDFGRSRSCKVQLSDGKASRRHFTITEEDHQFVLRDLESSNGTMVNGKPVTDYRLQSGDIVSVGDEKFIFEQINPDFENLPAVINSEKTEPAVIKMPAPLGPAPWNQPVPPGPFGTGQKIGDYLKQRGPRQLQIVRLTIVGALAFVVIYLATSGGPEDQKRNQASDGPPVVVTNPDAVAFQKLTPEQQKFVEETYELAMNLYKSGKYDLAAIEIGKIFSLVPNYKDSRELLAESQVGLERTRQNEEEARKQKEQAELKSKVDGVLDACETLLNQKRYSEIESCVARITDLDPDNERGQVLIGKAQEAELNIKLKKDAIADAVRRKHQAQQFFERAQKEYQEKRYPAAIGDFERVTRIAFSDSESLKQKAKLGLGSAKQKLLEQSQALVNGGKSALDARDYKTAITNFDKALAVSPGNEDAQKYREQAETEMRSEMKNIYSESVIEENLGNIESAKKKWKLILDQDLKTDPYYEKARIKLGKYEK